MTAESKLTMNTHNKARTAADGVQPSDARGRGQLLPSRGREVRMTVPVAGSDISLLRSGEGHAVVLAHSYLWDAEMWRPQIEALSRGYRVIVPELWGHGASGDMPVGTRTLRDVAVQHLALLDRLGLESIILVGLSVGAMWAAELALIAPGRVRALVLMDSFMGLEPEGSRLRYDAFLDAIEATGTVSVPLLDAVVPLFFSPRVGERDPALRDRFRASLAAWEPRRMRTSVVPLGRMIFGRRDGLEDLRALRMPTLVMGGADDLSRPSLEGRQMAEVLGCRFVEIKGAGHISSLEAPDAATGALRRFLDGAVGPDGRRP